MHDPSRNIQVVDLMHAMAARDVVCQPLQAHHSRLGKVVVDGAEEQSQQREHDHVVCQLLSRRHYVEGGVDLVAVVGELQLVSCFREEIGVFRTAREGGRVVGRHCDRMKLVRMGGTYG